MLEPGGFMLMFGLSEPEFKTMTQAASQDGPSAPLLHSFEEGIATLTLNRPERYNTLSLEVIDAF